jgi:hypothetical protein
MITASIQADMAIKILTNKETIDEMIRFDIKNSEIEKIRIKKINCEACKGKYEYLQRKTTIVKSCGEYFQITNKPINLKKLKNKLEKLGKVKYYEEYLQYKNIIIFNNGRALIKAKNEKQAKSDFSKFIGN